MVSIIELLTNSPEQVIEKRKKGNEKPLRIYIGPNDTEFASLAVAILDPLLSHEEVSHTNLRELAIKVAGGPSPLNHEYPDRDWAIDRWITKFLTNPGSDDQKERKQAIKDITKKNVTKMLETKGKQKANEVAAHHIQKTICKIFLGNANIFTEEQRIYVFQELFSKKILTLAALVKFTEQIPGLSSFVQGRFDSAVNEMSQIIVDAVSPDDDDTEKEEESKSSFVIDRLELLYAAIENGETKIGKKDIPEDVIDYIKKLSDEEKANIFETQVRVALSAGTETTVSIVSRITLILANDRKLQEDLIKARLLKKDKPGDRTFDELAGKVLERVYSSNAPAIISRQIREDMTLEGVPLKENDFVIISPDVADGEILNIFGHKQNARFCVGMPLAALEAKTYIEELVDGLIEQKVRLKYHHNSKAVEKSDEGFTHKPKYDTFEVVAA